MSTLKRFIADDEGAALIEYGLILALIAVVCLAALTTIGTDVRTKLNSIVGAI